VLRLQVQQALQGRLARCVLRKNHAGRQSEDQGYCIHNSGPKTGEPKTHTLASRKYCYGCTVRTLSDRDWQNLEIIATPY
jgi:hypothetical protein